MYNLLLKDLKLCVHPAILLLPFLFGALMLIPGWIYFIVIMYFFWITAPNLFNQFKTQNDLLFTAMMPVTKKDIVKARVSLIIILELLHILIAMIFGLFTFYLYPDFTYYFFAPHLGFWGLCFVMLAIYNLFLIPMYYKTAYKSFAAQLTAIIAAIVFAVIVQWVGIQNAYVSDIFNGSGTANFALQSCILFVGIAIFFASAWIGYLIAVKRFKRVEIH